MSLTSVPQQRKANQTKAALTKRYIILHFVLRWFYFLSHSRRVCRSSQLQRHTTQTRQVLHSRCPTLIRHKDLAGHRSSGAPSQTRPVFAAVCLRVEAGRLHSILTTYIFLMDFHRQRSIFCRPPFMTVLSRLLVAKSGILRPGRKQDSTIPQSGKYLFVVWKVICVFSPSSPLILPSWHLLSVCLFAH